MAGDWSYRRKEVTYEEARTVLNRQHDTLSDIDDKAVRTVRITAILLGVIVTGVQVAGIEMFNFWLLIIGGGTLFGSLVAGMMTYSESNLYLGPNEDYVRQLTRGQFYGTDWDEDLLLTMGHWIDENHRDIEWNGWLLTATQLCLSVGILFTALAVVF